MKTVTATVLAAFIASACATSGGEIERSSSDRLLTRYEPFVGEPIDRFTAFRPDSWQPISRTQLVVWTSINDAYLLTVDNTCPELNFAQKIGVTSTGSSISKFDSVIVRDQRCRIEQIQPIDVERMKADRRAAEARG